VAYVLLNNLMETVTQIQNDVAKLSGGGPQTGGYSLKTNLVRTPMCTVDRLVWPLNVLSYP